MSVSIRIKRGLEANLPSLLIGELAYTTDTNKLYIGVDLREEGAPEPDVQNVLVSNLNNYFTKTEIEGLIGDGLSWNEIENVFSISVDTATIFDSPIFTGQVAFTPETLGTTGTINIDFADSTYRTQAALTGNVTYTGSNYFNGRSVTIRVINGSTQRTLTFPSEWRFLGDKPTNIAANKIGVLTVASFGSSASDVVAAWAVEI